MHMCSNRGSIKDLLTETRQILDSPDFNIDTDYVLIKSKKEEIEYSTPTTLLDLEFDDEDALEAIKTLRLEDYSHTLFDRDNDQPSYLYVFGKEIQGKLVYIKYKIREGKRIIICVSFHYPKESMEFPYK